MKMAFRTWGAEVVEADPESLAMSPAWGPTQHLSGRALGWTPDASWEQSLPRAGEPAGGRRQRNLCWILPVHRAVCRPPTPPPGGPTETLCSKPGASGRPAHVL